MMFISHFIFYTTGVLLFSSTTNLLNSVQLTIALLLGYFFSGVPDIDSEKSWISRKIPLLPGIIGRFTTHRGIFHTPLPLAILAAIPSILLSEKYYSNTFWFFAIYSPMVSHILTDSLTSGSRKIMFFYPISKKGAGLSLFRTGSKKEVVLLISGIALSSYLLFHYEKHFELAILWAILFLNLKRIYYIFFKKK